MEGDASYPPILSSCTVSNTRGPSRRVISTGKVHNAKGIVPRERTHGSRREQVALHEPGDHQDSAHLLQPGPLSRQQGPPETVGASEQESGYLAGL